MPRFFELSRVVWLNVICDSPKATTLKVKVARTPLPLAVEYSSRMSEMSGM